MRSRQGEHPEEVVNLSTSTSPLDVGFCQRKKKQQKSQNPNRVAPIKKPPGVVWISRGCVLVQVCNTRHRTTKLATSVHGVQIVLFFVLVVCTQTETQSKREKGAGNQSVCAVQAKRCHLPALPLLLEVAC